MGIESQILDDLRSDKARYKALLQSLPVDEEGCTIDEGLRSYYMATLWQIEKDIVRWLYN